MAQETGFTVWLTGMLGAGKSTLAQYIEARLAPGRAQGRDPRRRRSPGRSLEGNRGRHQGRAHDDRPPPGLRGRRAHAQRRGDPGGLRQPRQAVARREPPPHSALHRGLRRLPDRRAHQARHHRQVQEGAGRRDPQLRRHHRALPAAQLGRGHRAHQPRGHRGRWPEGLPVAARPLVHDRRGAQGHHGHEDEGEPDHQEGQARQGGQGAARPPSRPRSPSPPRRPPKKKGKK